MEERAMYSPETGEAMYRDTRPMEITYKNVSMVFEMPGWYTAGSDEGIFDPADQKVYNKAINQLKAQVEQLLQPEEIRQVRLSLNLTQQQAGYILGGGKNAFQKYEAGEVLPSKAISNLLKVLAKEPSLLSIL